MSRDPTLFLEDIERSCAKIVRFTQDADRDEALSDEMRFDALLLNLQVIGEAVKNLPDDLRQRYPDIAWREIAGMRDLIVHAYFALDLDILWDAIVNDVPKLLTRVRHVLEVERADH